MTDDEAHSSEAMQVFIPVTAFYIEIKIIVSLQNLFSKEVELNANKF